MTGRRFQNTPDAGDWVTLTVHVPVEEIQRVCVYMEAYDNLCIVRTPHSGAGKLSIFCWHGSAGQVRRIFEEIAKEIPVVIGPLKSGMADFDRLWEDDRT